ncbi:MAG: GDSL-type esterase/lipase family protein [Prolixibacteraceae bacterium]
MRLLLIILALLSGLCAWSQNNGFSASYNRKASLFQLLPNTKNEIIFLGNSMTAGGEWGELLQNSHVKNRGISGDTTKGIMNRLGEVTASSPRKVFLLIGINDLATGKSKETVFENICKIAQQIRKDSPRTKVYIQSMFPVNDQLRESPVKKDEEIVWVNKQLENWCLSNNFEFIELYSHFVVPGTYLLNPVHTNDGGHFTGEAYLKWAAILKPYVKEK